MDAELKKLIASHKDLDPEKLIKVLKILDPSLDDAKLAQVLQASGNGMEDLCNWVFNENSSQPSSERSALPSPQPPNLDEAQTRASGVEKEQEVVRTSPEDASRTQKESQADCPVTLDKPTLQIIPEKNLSTLPPEGEDVNVLIRLHQQEGTGTVRTPVDIICVLDVSGSMGAPAKTANSESSGLSLLDVALHGIKTVINTLEAQDRLALVVFDHSHEVLFELTSMDEAGRTSTQERVSKITTRGATDIWGGLKAGLEVCKRGQLSADASSKRLAHLMLLTDGQTADRNSVIPSMLAYQAQQERLPCTVSTMGFGYAIDSPLLADMAKHGSGCYSFIPDAGFVGTIFVNLMSNFLVTMAQQVSLVLEPNEDAVIKHIYGGHKITDIGSGSKQVELAFLQHGQSKDIIVQMCLKTQGDYLAAQASYELPGSRGVREQTDFVEACTQRVETDFKQLDPQFSRSKFVDTLASALQGSQSNQTQQVSKAAAATMADLSREIRRCPNMDGYLSDLLQDIEGEASAALADDGAFQKWGKHYLPSLLFAHRLQICNNFKDPGVQHYGGELFSRIQDFADEQFNTLPPPQPRAQVARGQTISAPVNMANFNDRYAG